MRRIWAVAATEFINTLFSKGFLLAVTLTPMIVGASLLAQKYLREHASADQWRFAIIDPSGRLAPAIMERARQRNAEKGFREVDGKRRQVKTLFAPYRADSAAGLAEKIRREELFAYVLIAPDILERETADALVYHTGTPTNITLPLWLEQTMNEELRRLRVDAAAVDQNLFKSLIRFVPMARKDIHRAGGPSIHLGATFGVPAAAMFLLFILVFISAPMLLHSILEEKQQRIWEVLVSSVSPFDLLLGKLLGAVMVSMVLSVFYLGGAALFAHLFGIAHAVPASLYAWFLFYQLLAMLIYGSMFSAIGAACSEIRDAQSLMMPAMLLIVLPMFGWVTILRAPTSAFASALSLFPPATPMLMLLRIALPPGPAAWEIALSILLTSAFSLACIWVAGKIFRVGILAQGQSPTIGRLISWISTQ
ncbi:MAG: ABC transporter permease [Elusimicrobiota bacterium]